MPRKNLCYAEPLFRNCSWIEKNNAHDKMGRETESSSGPGFPFSLGSSSTISSADASGHLLNLWIRVLAIPQRPGVSAGEALPAQG